MNNGRWCTTSEAAALLGISDRQVRRRGYDRRPAAGSQGFEYLIPGVGDATPEPEPQHDPCDDAVTEHLLADDEVRSTGATVDRDGYVYVGATDTYIIQCAPAGGHLVRTGAWVRQMWRAYTVGGMTVPEVCRKYTIDRRVFEAAKRSLGLTHTSAPWTDEEIAGSSVDALATDALRSREQRALNLAERADWKRTRQDAQRWRMLHESIREAVAELDVPRAQITPEPCERGPWDCLVGTTDLHVGKRTAGKDHTLASQVDGLRDLLLRIPDDVCETWGRMPSRWIVIIGSDLLHSDTYGQTTTSGTPQGAQSVGSTGQALRAAVGLLASLIDELATSAPVLAVHVPGNHDRVLGHAVACALEQRYHEEPRVTVDADESPHRALAVGRVPLMLHHGDGADAARAAATLRRDAPPECDVRHAMIAHGHLHRRRAAWSDDHGTLTICMASPATADDWHATKHYTGSRQAVGVWRIHHSGRLPMPLWVER